MTVIFWILTLLFIYAYFGYALLLYVITRFIPEKKKPVLSPDHNDWPTVTLFITAYNETDILKQKVENCFALNYPADKLDIAFVTDGSTDGSEKYLSTIEGIKVFHEPARKGKINAMNRGMKFIGTEVVIFTDANTQLNPEAVQLIAAQFTDPTVGCVAGRKKVVSGTHENAAGAGEGLYWQFESWLKKLDARFFAPVGAVGELFSIRKALFEEVPFDTILDDMVISFRILQKGYRLTYVPGAIASETASFNMNEELKRKIRIAAGGIQTLFRMLPLLNPFRYPRLSFQFFSHKVSRWTFAPWCFFLLFPVNIVIFTDRPNNLFWVSILMFQTIFYVLALIGWIAEEQGKKISLTHLPYYFTAINLATIRGQFRYLKGKQPAAWDKARRMQ
jgi:cellulose synthase/poly-beta-1,6-N-acetylglucosamine synthase-like glycosyltransferase